MNKMRGGNNDFNGGRFDHLKDALAMAFAVIHASGGSLQFEHMHRIFTQ